MAPTSVPQRTLRTPEEIDADEQTNAALFPPISHLAQNALDAAEAITSALVAADIAGDLDREATGRYEAGISSLSAANPYTRRVAYLQLLQAFHEQPDAVEKALGRLYEQLESVPFSPFPACVVCGAQGTISHQGGPWYCGAHDPQPPHACAVCGVHGTLRLAGERWYCEAHQEGAQSAEAISESTPPPDAAPTERIIVTASQGIKPLVAPPTADDAPRRYTQAELDGAVDRAVATVYQNMQAERAAPLPFDDDEDAESSAPAVPLLDALRAIPESPVRLQAPYLPNSPIDTSLALSMLDGLAGIIDLAPAPALERSPVWRIGQALRTGREYGDPLHSVALLLQLEAVVTHPHATISALSDVRGMLGAALVEGVRDVAA